MCIYLHLVSSLKHENRPTLRCISQGAIVAGIYSRYRVRDDRSFFINKGEEAAIRLISVISFCLKFF